MNILNLKSNKFLIILGLPIFISFSINENLIYFNRNVWDTFPPDSFSLPLGLICSHMHKVLALPQLPLEPWQPQASNPPAFAGHTRKARIRVAGRQRGDYQKINLNRKAFD